MHRARRVLASTLAVVLGAALAPSALLPAAAQTAPVGQGFNLNASDLRFILKQIKIAEQHASTLTPANPCGTLLGSGPDQIPNAGNGDQLPWGLRTVDGSCNNLVAGQERFGAADQVFPRLVPKQLKDAEAGDPDGPTGPAQPGPTSYTSTDGVVFDSEPRTVSNLIVDQTVGNPAAVAAAGENPADPVTGEFFIPNSAPDEGLSAPYNSWFTLFGQFFDHGLDLVGKGGNGTVFVPLKGDDPLIAGRDGVVGTADDPANPPPPSQRFMALSRATHDGDHEAKNKTATFVDQSQTYTSHPSHAVFLREYAESAAGPLSTGKLITGATGGMATWADLKTQAAARLGIELVDTDVHAVPLLRTDPYGRFVRGASGLPLLVTGLGPDGAANTGDDQVVEGNLTTPVLTAGAIRTSQAFLDDIAHHAVPGSYDTNGDRLGDTPQVPDADPGTTDDRLANTYDDEMLAAHFMAGDGRVNENIGLTAVHHVFHSEHNRLAEQLDVLINGVDDPATPAIERAGAITTAAEATEWNAVNAASGYDFGERLFQAARFVTEMEYQHLAFEEFARKVQPLVNPFGEGGTGYNTSINPAIRAEFAHAVYRFGHSLLTDTVARTGSSDDISLLTAFLNPPTFLQGRGGTTLTPDQAAGDVVRGMTRQIGNELDEFVTDALRNQLLGLPLDLATLNIARARETGTPTLNAARRSFFAESNNSALAPYQSWADFSFNLKNRDSLNNFIAAYGTHPDVVAATTAAGKRAVADAIVFGTAGRDGIQGDLDTTSEDESLDDIPAADVPADSYAFLNSSVHETTDDQGVTTPVHSTWVTGADGVTKTGVDDIDLWVGGLAEAQMAFGGLLGPTFNYVFEAQMEDLQFGDRFYYLSRTAGLNMLTQLEGNSFAELIQRNTDVSGLPADSFSRPDLIFDVSKLGTSGPLLDDPATPYNEANLREGGVLVLTRMPDGTIRYSGGAHAVFNGTSGNNRMWSGAGDDTVRGNDGNDWMQGGDGNDNLIGGLGDDILLDSAGDDNMKGGDGNDVLSSGQGFGGDLMQGGRDKDFVVHGNDLAESFAGPGDDFVLGGAGDDTVFGDDGDDWIESGATVTGTGGGAFNLLQGDNGAPFQDDPNEPGHDVLIGYGGENDYDAEGGDDVMLLGPGIQRNEGMLGFDYVTHESDPAAGNSDMNFTGLLPPSVETNVDRFDLVESLSGWDKDDTLRGDSRDAPAMVGHELNEAGIARVAGLQALLPAGATSFTGGNILMGGAGSDLIEGRGGNDILDGDAYLNTRISVRDLATGTTELESVDNMRGVQARVLAGTINPGQLHTVREILTPANGTAVDTALFSGAIADYTFTPARDGNQITTGADGVVTVDHGAGVDGVDRVRNVERLQFTDGTVTVVAPAPVVAPAGGAFRPVTPTRIVDTRDGTGSPATPLLTNATRSFQVTGVAGVPATGVSAIVLNVTATQPEAAGYLKVFPGGGTVPASSNVNFVAGQSVPNLVQVAVGATGQISVLNGSAGSTHVIADVAGYVTTVEDATGPAGLFNSTNPFRIMDTRLSGGAIDGATSRVLKVTGTAGSGSAVPETGVSAVALNVTVTGPTQDSFLTVYPGQQDTPGVSNLNFVAGQTVPNRVIVPVSPDGTIRLLNAAGQAHVVVDVNGWFTDASSTAGGATFVALAEPQRVQDTRTGAPVGESLAGQRTVGIAGANGIPAMDAPHAPIAVVANVTVTQPDTGGAGSYLTVYPTGTELPTASDLNFVDGQTVPNLTITRLSPQGEITQFNAKGNTHVITDVLGYYAN